MTDWAVKHIGFECDGLEIGGLNVWEKEWRQIGDCAHVDLPHPAHPNEIHRYWIYEIGDEASPVRFASGELSPGVYGFYVPGDCL
jgi:hypothetical protein